MSFLFQVSIAVAVGYAVGAIPSAFLAGHIFKKQDIRWLGDGNVGAENAYRELGPKVGLAVLVADIGKGAFCVALIKGIGFAEGAALSSGAAAVVGHNWPVFLQFKGGRGAATSMGALLAALYPAAFIAGAVGMMTLLRGSGDSGERRRGLLPREFSGTRACAATFVPLPFVAWGLGYSVGLIVYSLALPVMVGIVHLYQMTAPSTVPTALPADGPALAAPDDAPPGT